MNKSWWSLPSGILLGLLSAGLVLWLSQPDQGTAVVLRPPPTPAPMLVDVDGEVAQPGLYHLPLNSRVQDAVQAAGGFTAEANQQAVNLAAFLEDGDHLLIPGHEQEYPSTLFIQEEQTLRPTATVVRFPVNINTANQEELQALPGIGPVTAEKIISYRQEAEFKLIEEIQKVSGIGPSTFEKIQPLITVDE